MGRPVRPRYRNGRLALPLALSRRLEIIRPAVTLVATSGVCEVLGFYSYTTGARHGIAVAAVLASQVGGLAALGAYFVFGQRLSRRRTLGVCTCSRGWRCSARCGRERCRTARLLADAHLLDSDFVATRAEW